MSNNINQQFLIYLFIAIKFQIPSPTKSPQTTCPKPTSSPKPLDHHTGNNKLLSYTPSYKLQPMPNLSTSPPKWRIFFLTTTLKVKSLPTHSTHNNKCLQGTFNTVLPTSTFKTYNAKSLYTPAYPYLQNLRTLTSTSTKTQYVTPPKVIT